MNKKKLRLVYKEKRKKISIACRVKSIQIVEELKRTNILSAENHHLFLPIDHQQEVHTWYLLSYLAYKQKQIILSKSIIADCSMVHYIWRKNTMFKNNKWGIPEPQQALPLPCIQTIDVVYVPMLISDSRGFRVGYGKGFYDRFLSSIGKHTQVVGLNFFEPVDIIPDLDQNDRAMDWLVTPHKTYRYNR